MYTKQEIIIRSYREGKSQRSISRELQISRKTVKKYIEEYDSYLRDTKSGGLPVNNYLLSKPVYNSATRGKIKLTQEVQESIDKLLEENRQKEQEGLRKQLLKKHDIFESLQDQGFEIGYTTVCNYIRTKLQSKPQNKEAFIRQEYLPGQVCEFDWGEIKLFIGDKLERFQLAVFTSAYSNYRYAAIYHRQDTLSFMESHVRFFTHINGVYKQMVYDNMRVAVSKFVGPKEKEPTRALLQMRGHYQFTHRFCNAYRGNEKGHVERSVEFIRRKAFGIKSRFNTLDQAEKWLGTVLQKLNNGKQKQTGKTANELFSEELKLLGALPQSELICSEQVQLRADKYATVSYRTNHYSVPEHLVGEFVEAHILSHQVQIFHNNKLYACHKRDYGKHQWIIDIEHYLSTFKKKPGALPASVALASSSYLKQLYMDYFRGRPRDFIDLLAYCSQHRVSNEKLDESVRRLLSSGSTEINTERLKALLGNTAESHINTPDNLISQMSKKQLSQITALLN